jgi:hypothetical protein
MASFSTSIFAQQIDNSDLIPDEISDDQILYLQVSPKNEAADDIIDGGIALSEPEIAAWGDYSCYLRFSNVNKTQYIDARDQGNEAGNMQCLDTIMFEFDEIYNCWLEISMANMTYNVYILVPDETEPRMIAENAKFRKIDIASLKYYTSMHNPDNSQNAIEVIDIMLVDEVGQVAVEDPSAILSRENNTFQLSNYPNPAIKSTTISYEITTANNVKLKVFDVKGTELTTLINGFQTMGNYNIQLDLSNFESGMYFYSLSVGEQISAKKLIIE